MALRSLCGPMVALALLATACATTLDAEVARDQSGGGSESSAGDTGTGVGETATDGVDSGSDPSGSGRRASWSEAACEFDEPESVDTVCGWLTVPEHWDDPDDTDTLRLHVGIFSASGPADPIVYLEGGPGADALANISQSFSVLFAELVQDHDIVIIGQRGTGSADPTLKCEAVTDVDFELLASTTEANEELLSYSDAYHECAVELREQGVDPSAYNSVQNAHDVDALRAALGYRTWNLLGISYGTRLAQSVMRLHPEGVRAAILDSVLAYEREPSVDIPQVANRAFDQLFAGCADSDQCAAQYPDLELRFFAMVEQLDAEPIQFPVLDSLTGAQYQAALDGSGLMDLAFGALYSEAAFSALPELVDQLEQGDNSGVQVLVGQDVTSWPFIADGMYWSVQCNEEIPFLGADAIEQGRSGDPRYDRMIPSGTADFFVSVCDAFQAGEAPPEEDQLLLSDIPSLLLAGSYDPITPPADTRSVGVGLAISSYVEFPNTGHAAMVEECAQAIAVEFLADPLSAPDSSCAALDTEPVWAPDNFTDIVFEPFEFETAFVRGSGVAPAGWEESFPGTFVQSENLLHVSVVLQQGIEGVPADFAMDNMSGVLGGEPVELPDLVVDGRTWRHIRVDVPGSVVDMFAADSGGDALLVLFQNAPGDRSRALEVLTEPILAAFDL